MQQINDFLNSGAVAYVHIIPLVLVVSIVWGATRHPNWTDALVHAVRFGVMVLVFMAIVFGVLMVAPLLPWYVWAVVVGGLFVFSRWPRPAAQAQTQADGQSG